MRSFKARAGDLEQVASYLHEHEIACALAHPFYASSPRARRSGAGSPPRP
jgi:hypothetical protein